MNSEQVFIQHRFTIERDGLTLQDALVMPMEDYEKLTPEDIEAQKEQRFANWSEQIKNPPPQVELSKEEQLAQVENDLKSIEEQKVQLTSRKVELASAIAVEVLPVEEVIDKSIKGGK